MTDKKALPSNSQHKPVGEMTKRTPDMHSRVREVMAHHRLTVFADGVIEADLIEAVLASLEGAEIGKGMP